MAKNIGIGDTEISKHIKLIRPTMSGHVIDKSYLEISTGSGSRKRRKAKTMMET